MTSFLRSLAALLPAALLLIFPAAAQEPQDQNVLTRIEKAADEAVSEASFQIRDKLDFTANARTRSDIERANELRLLRASAAGKFADEHFTNKIVVPILFNCQDDPLEDQELKVFLEQAMSVKIAGPVYITPPDGALPLPDEQPTAEQLNEALLRSIELRADAVVVFTGLPAQKKERDSLVCLQWREHEPRLIFTEVVDSFFLKRAMFPCPVAAAVLPRQFPPEAKKKPWYDFLLFWRETPPAPDPFDLHYILLTDENADDRIKDQTVFLSDGEKKTPPAPVQLRQEDSVK